MCGLALDTLRDELRDICLPPGLIYVAPRANADNNEEDGEEDEEHARGVTLSSLVTGGKMIKEFHFRFFFKSSFFTYNIYE